VGASLCVQTTCLCVDGCVSDCVSGRECVSAFVGVSVIVVYGRGYVSASARVCECVSAEECSRVCKLKLKWKWKLAKKNRGLASGEWRVASGEWQVASGKWQVASSKQQVTTKSKHAKKKKAGNAGEAGSGI